MNPNRRPRGHVTVMDGSMGRQLCIEGLPCGELFHKIWAASALADPAYHELVVSTVDTRACSRRPAKENLANGLIKELASLALAKMA